MTQTNALVHSARKWLHYTAGIMVTKWVVGCLWHTSRGWLSWSETLASPFANVPLLPCMLHCFVQRNAGWVLNPSPLLEIGTFVGTCSN